MPDKEHIELNVNDVVLAKINFKTEPHKIINTRPKRDLLLEKPDGERFWWAEEKLRACIQDDEE